MRLLKLNNNGELNLTKDLIGKTPPYGILSHTWGDDEEEVTFEDLKNGLAKKRVGYKKIQFCAEQATRDGLQYFWVDTCCIDKSNNAELSEAIVSMFRWYRNATKCYAYLADVSVDNQDPSSQSFQSWGPAFRKSRWFTRGWTLQELIAPSSVEFFSMEGKLLGDKKSLERQVHEITGIATQALQGNDLSKFSVTERLSWAESRGTKREEDKAYSLLGMFNVYMPLLYGEGVGNAFRRLREEISKCSSSTHSRADLLPLIPSAGETVRNEASWNSELKSSSSRHEDIKARRLFLHLKFSVIRDREDRIASALTDTFEWIYDNEIPETGQFTWNPFVRWLKSNSGLYWIAGKAGSGKSTLMKFLHSDPRTKEHLGVWAHASTLVIAGHFFWNSGNSIQMAVEGLIRTLLYDIGTQLPGVLPDLFPERWAEMESSLDPKLVVLQPWTTFECLQAFRKILSHPFNHYKFFFFVDGLDECTGDHEELTVLLKEMASSPHIKMCLASRPWSVFQDAFNSSPSLMLQQLTSRDISLYVRTKFYKNRGFLELEKSNSKLAAQLCDDITEKASGVFLWVRLVVLSLLRGITNGDRVIDLTRRLDDLPEDLGMLFSKILDSVDPAYKLHSAQLFQIHRTASEYHDGISLLRFSYADDHDRALCDEEERSLDRDEFVYRVKSMDRRLDSRTKGLLETPTSFIDEIEDKLPSNFLSWSNATPKVQYLHRTLKDYIEQPEIWNQICATTPSFSPHASLCKAYALEIKGIDYNISHDYENDEDTLEEIQYRIPELVADAMYICALADDRQSKSLIYVLDALDTILTRKFAPRCHRQVAQAPLSPPLIMSLAIRYDLHFWIEELLKRGHPVSLSQSGPPLILIAIDIDDFLELPGMPLDMNWERQRIRHRPSSRCLEALLSHGADPCEEYEGSTAWSYFVDKFAEILEDPEILEDFAGNLFNAVKDSETGVFREWLDIAEIFISYAASISLFRHKVLPLVHEFAHCYRDLYRESGDLQRLCQILEIEYENLWIGESADENENDNEDGSEYGSGDDNEDENVNEGVEERVDKSFDASQDPGHYQFDRKRKWTS